MYFAFVAAIPGAHKAATSWWLVNVANKQSLSPVSTFTTPAGKSDESTTCIKKNYKYFHEFYLVLQDCTDIFKLDMGDLHENLFG